MPEEQAFSVLVKIMFDYELRKFFKDGFHDLHLRFYQLERLLQVSLAVSMLSQLSHAVTVAPALTCCSVVHSNKYRICMDTYWTCS